MAWCSETKSKQEIMVFRPTMEMFSNFERCIEHMESMGAHKIGLAKLIPPKEWVARASGYDNLDIVIPSPIKQEALGGSKGIFKVINVASKSMTVQEYQQLANSSRYSTPKNRGYDDLERKFWNSLSIPAPIYGADVAGSVTDSTQKTWNIARLDTMLNRVLKTRIAGVNTPYLYFGMWKAMFAWHIEDMELYSINYLHFGAAKAWYAIPPEYGQRFERLARGLFPIDAKECPAFLRHKMYLITPRTLHDNSIPFYKAWQEPGEFMITFPFSYHAGYNLGYNCAESTNFATERWIDYGKSCTRCECNSDMVKIDMEPFVREFQPDRYRMWLSGCDNTRHPEDELDRLYPHREAARVQRQMSIWGNVQSVLVADQPQTAREFLPSKAPKLSNFLCDETKPSVMLSSVVKPPCKTDAFGIKRHRQDIQVGVNRTSGAMYTDVNMSQCSSAEKKIFNRNHLGSLLAKDCQTSKTANSSRKQSKRLRKNFCATEKNSICCSPVNGKNGDVTVVEKLQEFTSNQNSVAVTLQQSTFLSRTSACENNGYLPIVLNGIDPKLVSVATLFSFYEENFADEISFNEQHASTPPHCSVCSLFVAAEDEALRASAVMTHQSEPCIPESIFSRSSHSSPLEFSNCLNLIVVCSKCGVCVHAKCYGESETSNKSWICDRCRSGCYSESCCLCKLRGGALKASQDGLWAHIVCVLCADLAARFDDLPKRSIDIDFAMLNYSTCIYCHQRSVSLCLSCAKCDAEFHVTCGRIAGATFLMRHSPSGVIAVCHKHTKQSQIQKPSRIRSTVAIGDKVIAKYRNGRYYHCVVTTLSDTVYCKVAFEDGTFSDDMFPEDIESLEGIHMSASHRPASGSYVNVRWRDGKLYRALFRGVSSQSAIEVQFEDGSVLKTDREKIWASSEELPPAVASKLPDSYQVAHKTSSSAKRAKRWFCDSIATSYDED